MSDFIVVKPHSIITARMNLAPREQDFLTFLILSVKKEYDKLKFSKEWEGGGVCFKQIPQLYSFSKKELEEVFSWDPSYLRRKDKVTKTYCFDDVCKSLWDRGIEIRNENEFYFTRLISFAKFDGKTLTVEIPSPILEEFVNYSKGGMSLIDYKLLFKLKGRYDKRLLELISRFKNTKDFSCSIGELCEMLGTDVKGYSSWRSFVGSVLKSPISAIIKESGGIWEAKDNKKNGFEFIKKTNAKHYSKDCIVVFKMKYNNTSVSEQTLLLKYNEVLEGTLTNMQELSSLLDDLIKAGFQEKVSNPEFIKMWAACMQDAK